MRFAFLFLSIASLIWVALTLHLGVWVLLPLFFEGSIRLDTAEHVLQGQEWLLANPKHPPFSTWLVALIHMLGPARYVAVYILGQALAVIGLLCASILLWREKNSNTAALAILIGLASPMFTYIPIQVNHNLGVMPFWGLALVTGYFAFEYGRIRDWLLFAVAVGFGMWAKYSILHLAVPLAIAFILVPKWRRRLASPGPWLAGVLAVLIFAPQLLAVTKSGSDAFLYAVRTSDQGSPDGLKAFFSFALSATALILLMGIVAAAAIGIRPLRNAVAASFRDLHNNRPALYLHVSLFGPLLFIAITTPFGVRPRVLWLTPIALSAALWWAEKTYRADFRLPRRAIVFACALSLLFAGTYIVRRIAPPFLSIAPTYADFDGPALQRMADRHWRSHVSGPIPYLVSFGRQRGRQAVGSIVFDSAEPPHVFEEADRRRSPWIDMIDLTRRGALVVSTRPLTAADSVAGQPIEQIVGFVRPTLRLFSKKQTIYLGIVRPSGVR